MSSHSFHHKMLIYFRQKIKIDDKRNEFFVAFMLPRYFLKVAAMNITMVAYEIMFLEKRFLYAIAG